MLSKSPPQVRYDHVDFTNKVTASIRFSRFSQPRAVHFAAR
jgi:hypothetical protein